MKASIDHLQFSGTRNAVLGFAGRDENRFILPRGRGVRPGDRILKRILFPTWYYVVHLGARLPRRMLKDNPMGSMQKAGGVSCHQYVTRRVGCA